MWSPDPQHLDGTKDSSVFALAVWQELFDPYTPDSFQPRLHNLASLASELTRTATLLQADSIWWKHIHELRGEISQVSAENASLLEVIPEYRWSIKQCLKADSKHDLLRKCRILDEKSPVYLNQIVSSIRAAHDLPAKNKAARYKALRSLATLAVQRSKEDDDILDSDVDCSKSETALFDRFILRTMDENQEYECIVAIAGDLSIVQKICVRSGFQQASKKRLDASELKSLDRTFGDNIYFFGTRLVADSFRHAVSEVRRKLGAGINIVNLYSNSPRLSLADVVFVKRGDSQSFKLFRAKEQAFRKLYPRSRAIEDAIDTLSLANNSQLEDRVLNALELHSLATTSSDKRVKIVNLWSALECLGSTRNSESKIKGVIELVSSILVWRRIDKVVRYAAISTQQFGDTIGQAAFGEGFERSHAKFVHPWDMALTLAKPNGHAHITQLLSFAGQHPFLVFRLHRLWQEFSSPKALLKSLTRSKERIKWQLFRIYRARNLLVHDGVEVPFVGALLDNLQYYSSIVISRIIHGLKLENSWSVSDSSEYWNSKCAYVLDSLSTNPSQLRVSDFFPLAAAQDAPNVWE